jgi:hypothetical protein
MLSIAIPDLAAVRRVGASEIDALRTNLAALHSLDDRYGGGSVADLAARQADRVEAVQAATSLL